MNLLVYCASFLLLIYFSVNYSEAHLSSTQRKGLVDLYNHCEGHSWKLSAGRNKWNIHDEDACSWGGVTCHPESAKDKPQTIERLNFRHFGMRCPNGFPKGAFRHMVDLKHLDAAHNNLNMHSHDEFKDLHKLRHLILDNNGLKSIPTPPPGVEMLSLENNDFRPHAMDGGKLISIHIKLLETLPKIKKLFLANTSFSGAFPCDVLHKMSHLEELDLSNNTALNGSFCPAIETHPTLSKLYLEGTSVQVGKYFPVWVTRLKDYSLPAAQQYEGPCPIPEELMKKGCTPSVQVCCSGDGAKGCTRLHRRERNKKRHEDYGEIDEIEDDHESFSKHKCFKKIKKYLIFAVPVWCVISVVIVIVICLKKRASRKSIPGKVVGLEMAETVYDVNIDKNKQVEVVVHEIPKDGN